MNTNSLLLAFFLLLIGGSVSAQYSILDPDYSQASPLNCDNVPPGPNFTSGPTPYTPNMADTFTVCPDLTMGSKVSIAFATNIGYYWDIDPSDTVYIFDGPSTSSPLLGAYNNATNPNGFFVSASFENNPSGCLTIVFHSDGASEGQGFFGHLACGDLAQPFTPHLEAFVNGQGANALNPIDTGYVNICFGDSVLFVAKPVFPYSFENTGTGYSQTVDNAAYYWTVSGVGTFNDDDSIWITPPQRQGYYVDCRITDQFPQVMHINAKIRVSTLPSFATTRALEDTLCIGDQTNLLGGVTAQDTVGVSIPGNAFAIGGSFAGLTALPDGTGVQYQTSIPLSGFNGGTVTSANDIASVCLDIEHSYIGDIEIALQCPNGTMVSLMNCYNLAGGLIPGGCGNGFDIFLGNDTDIDGGAPGSPVWTYCFSAANATNGTICADALAGNTIPNASGFGAIDPSGVFMPDGNFANFIGCPLDGNWTIVVQDNQGIDDGYIFQWSIQFDQSLYPDLETYQNYVVSSFWSPDPSIISGQNDTSIVIQPTTPGFNYYTYNVTDDFGCPFDTTIAVFVMPVAHIFSDTIACDFGFQVTGTQTYQGGAWSATPAGLNFSSTTANNPSITATNSGLYTVTFIDQACGDTVNTTINFAPYPQIFADTQMCDLGFQVANTQAFLTGGYWTSNNPEISFAPDNGTLNPAINAITSGYYQVTFTDSVCGNSTSAHITMFEPPRIFGDTIGCYDVFQTFDNFAVSGGTWYALDTAMHISPITDVNPVFQTSAPGVYTVSFVDNQCHDSLTSTIFFPGFPWTPISDTVVCEGVTFTLKAAIDTSSNSYVWNTGATGTSIVVSAPGTYTITSSNECYTFIDSAIVTWKVCDINAPNIIVRSSKAGNNKFILTYDGIAEFHCTIVNRWGNVVYEFSDVSAAWDGKDQNGTNLPTGVYFYTFTATTIAGAPIEKQGFVQLFD